MSDTDKMVEDIWRLQRRQTNIATILSLLALALAIIAMQMAIKRLNGAESPETKVKWGKKVKAPSFASTDAGLLDAIAQVESGGDHKAVGAAGERGAWQFMESTWHDRTDLGFKWAHDPTCSRDVAQKHLRWLRRTLRTWMGHEPTDKQIVSAWNCGVGRMRSCDYDVTRTPQITQKYVSRVMSVVAQQGG